MVMDAGRPSGQPGEKWGGYVAASRSGAVPVGVPVGCELVKKQ